MRILVTGGAGFIGQHLQRALTGAGHEVRTHDAVTAPKGSGEHFTGDLLDSATLLRAVDGAETVVHLAAKHRFFGVSADEFRRVNVEGTRCLLAAASQASVRHLVFYSSVAVYGDRLEPTVEDTPCCPTTIYGETKLQAESLIRAWAAEDPARIVQIIRPTVVFGPGNRGNVYRLIRQVDRGLFVPIGAGANIKSVAYVENLVDATVFLMGRARVGVDVYNYADEPHLSFRETATLIHHHLKRRMPAYSLPVRPLLWAAAPVEAMLRLAGRDVPIRAAVLKMNRATHHSARKLMQAGFIPRVSIEHGLQRMIEWYLSPARTMEVRS